MSKAAPMKRGKRKRNNKPEDQGRVIKEKFKEERQHRSPPILAKTENQKTYLSYLKEYKLVVAIGPAGCGKTYLPAAIAGDALLKGDIDKIIVARPYVTMGKNLGALPGDETEKLYPFVRPMLDTIKERIGAGSWDTALAKGQVEVQALQSIRGRSFDGNMMVIIDEMQNATPEEVRSIVTRIGDGCQLVICGDPDQNDVRGLDGITYLTDVIDDHDIADTGIVEFDLDDIVRSGMVKDFVKAFRGS